MQNTCKILIVCNGGSSDNRNSKSNTNNWIKMEERGWRLECDDWKRSWEPLNILGRE